VNSLRAAAVDELYMDGSLNVSASAILVSYQQRSYRRLSRSLVRCLQDQGSRRHSDPSLLLPSLTSAIEGAEDRDQMTTTTTARSSTSTPPELVIGAWKRIRVYGNFQSNLLDVSVLYNIFTLIRCIIWSVLSCNSHLSQVL
jgi:hypothetical protein